MTAPAYLCDGRSVAPAEFYAVACDPQRSVVVEACAGAGKTWMLVSRILRALLDGAEPSQILAITFTRKAAGEMRERLDEWLHNFAAPGCDTATRIEALVQRGLPPAAAQALADRLGALQAQVLAAGRPVQVQTFHGWFAQLLSGAPRSLLRRLGLAPGVQLLEDPQELRPALMRAFHAAVDADAALRADYLALVRRHRRSTLLDWLGAAWQRGAELQAADAAGTLAPAVPAPLRDPAAVWADPRWRADLQALASALGARGKALSDTAAAGLAQALAADMPRAAFDAAWSALMTREGQPRSRMGDLPAQAELSAQLQAQQQDWLQLDAHDDHRRMVGLARVLLQAYTALKRRLGLADMADLEQVAQLLLTDPEAAGWVQERLDLRVRHLLIDEFQDTSPLQWQTLRPWLRRLRRRRRRRQWPAAAAGVHRRRPQTEHLPLPPRRAAGVCRRQRVRASTHSMERCWPAITPAATRPSCWSHSTPCSATPPCTTAGTAFDRTPVARRRAAVSGRCPTRWTCRSVWAPHPRPLDASTAGAIHSPSRARRQKNTGRSRRRGRWPAPSPGRWPPAAGRPAR